MIPGIDPKVDIAFKRVFGSTQWQNLTVSLIEAVLQPAPWQRLAGVELLNPYSEPMTLDDKLSILDIKARDDQGRLYNVEMQMAATASLPQRFLYYWSLLYTSQLARGDDYCQLCPTISICFVNRRMFADADSYHRRFRLTDTKGSLELTCDLDIHVVELVNFRKQLEDLNDPLDFWLFFLKNGDTLDADELPAPLDTRELRQAMEVLKMFSQDEMARELYQGRIKAARDARMYQADAQRALAQLAEAQQQRAQIEQERLEIEQQVRQAEQQVRQAEQQVRQAEQQVLQTEQQVLQTEQQVLQTEQQVLQTEQQVLQTEQQVRQVQQQLQHELARRIQLCERMLARPATDTGVLLQREALELREMADSLERELLRTR